MDYQMETDAEMDENSLTKDSQEVSDTQVATFKAVLLTCALVDEPFKIYKPHDPEHVQAEFKLADNLMYLMPRIPETDCSSIARSVFNQLAVRFKKRLDYKKILGQILLRPLSRRPMNSFGGS
jgi:hypothetical protein